MPHLCLPVEVFEAEGAEEGTAPLRSALFLVFMSSVTFLRPDVTQLPCSHPLSKCIPNPLGTNTQLSQDMTKTVDLANAKQRRPSRNPMHTHHKQQ